MNEMDRRAKVDSETVITNRNEAEAYIDDVSQREPLVPRHATTDQHAFDATAIERYKMLIHHAALSTDDDRSWHRLEFHRVLSTNDELIGGEYVMFDVHCVTCNWWDHWDEKFERC